MNNIIVAIIAIIFPLKLQLIANVNLSKIDAQFINEKLSQGQLCIPFVKSKRQLVDVFTTGLSSKCFYEGERWLL